MAKHAVPHPFAPLSVAEISSAADLIRAQWPAETPIRFKAITLHEPNKADVLPLLEREHRGETFAQLDRRAFVTYNILQTDKFHEAVVNVTEAKVETNVRLGKNVHAPADGAEINEIEKTVLEDASVRAAIAQLQLPHGSVVVCDPWIYGSDGVDDDERMWQAYLYVRDPANSSEADSNHYAHPLPISPVVSTVSMKILRIDVLPMGADAAVKELAPYKVHPANEYLPEYQNLRTDLKPLNVVQPDGASFKVTYQGTSQVVEWQKWRMRLGFNYREGLVLYDTSYDNRSLFYRVSLSDMNIPYADPRRPFHKKSAFDLGDVGAGVTANDLKLGCDCLGSIHYVSATLSNDEGKGLEMPNCVCIHEQDNGIGWKHTNFRTGRAAVVRNRELVLQMILTVANYEYILAFIFNQAGEMHYEVRATGILSTQPIDEGAEVPWGTVVHPGVLATYHQHHFSLRVDPAIDGHKNRLVYSEAHALPRDAKLNPHGIGYITQETVVRTSGGYDTDFDANRVFKIQNAAVRNPVNGLPVGYKIHVPPFQKGLADHDSFHFKRAEFADKAIYAVRYRDRELYAAGQYTNQSRGGTGVRAWADRNESIEDEDLVVYVNFGINHIPRVEDFPVMPCEVLKVSFKPVNFFDKNPALDVPPSTQAANKSVLVGGQGERVNGVNGVHGVNGANGVNGVHGVNGTNGVNGSCCTNGH